MQGFIYDVFSLWQLQGIIDIKQLKTSSSAQKPNGDPRGDVDGDFKETGFRAVDCGATGALHPLCIVGSWG